VQRSLNHVIEVDLNEHAGSVRWMLPEAESIPLALSLNELLSNAARHGDGRPIRCTASVTDDGVSIEIINGGRLPRGFELQSVPTGMAGLGLVRALLPRRAAVLEVRQADDRVLACLTLRPPSVRAAVPAELRHNPRQQAQLASTA
jgi:two-component sensor histidine kinase